MGIDRFILLSSYCTDKRDSNENSAFVSILRGREDIIHNRFRRRSSSIPRGQQRPLCHGRHAEPCVQQRQHRRSPLCQISVPPHSSGCQVPFIARSLQKLRLMCDPQTAWASSQAASRRFYTLVLLPFCWMAALRHAASRHKKRGAPG